MCIYFPTLLKFQIPYLNYSHFTYVCLCARECVYMNLYVRCLKIFKNVYNYKRYFERIQEESEVLVLLVFNLTKVSILSYRPLKTANDKFVKAKQAFQLTIRILR